MMKNDGQVSLFKQSLWRLLQELSEALHPIDISTIINTPWIVLDSKGLEALTSAPSVDFPQAQLEGQLLRFGFSIVGRLHSAQSLFLRHKREEAWSALIVASGHIGVIKGLRGIDLQALTQKLRGREAKLRLVNRADIVEKKRFLIWVKVRVAAGDHPRNLREVYELDGFEAKWSYRFSEATLKRWCKEGGFSLRGGRPKKMTY